MNPRLPKPDPLLADLNPAQLAEFTAELDAIRSRVSQDLGERDVSYLRRVASVKWFAETGGRAFLFAGVLPPAWGVGVALLSVSKMLDNMAIGHNVMHGQYDWMNDPVLNSKYEWDMGCPGDLWKRAHNSTHHVFTGILGKDRDIGYGLLRVSEKQPWNVASLLQPFSAVVLMLNFEWGISIYTVEIEQALKGRKALRSLISRGTRFGRKASQQIFKDYIGYPLLAGPFAPLVFSGNLTANVLRNIVSFGAIFCGHFPEGVQVQHPPQDKESPGARYLRQIRGSANYTAPRWFHVLTGHLGYQIEHHLFPSLPASRYEEIASEVEEICRKYGIAYNSRPFFNQMWTVARRICQLSLPN